MEEGTVKNKKILIVDDDEWNQYLMQEILEKDGYSFDVALNGEEAVTKVKSSGVGLVFMDIRMPVMNGYESSRAIRAFNKDIPIIALTAHAMEWVPEKCFAAGMNDFVSKPFDSETIKRSIENWMKC
ncbi:MAG: response regulator [Candidatus Omnitrophota bacterium]